MMRSRSTAPMRYERGCLSRQCRPQHDSARGDANCEARKFSQARLRRHRKVRIPGGLNEEARTSRLPTYTKRPDKPRSGDALRRSTLPFQLSTNIPQPGQLSCDLVSKSTKWSTLCQCHPTLHIFRFSQVYSNVTSRTFPRTTSSSTTCIMPLLGRSSAL